MLEFIQTQNFGSFLLKLSQSNLKLRLPDFYLIHSYLIATVYYIAENSTIKIKSFALTFCSSDASHIHGQLFSRLGPSLYYVSTLLDFSWPIHPPTLYQRKYYWTYEKIAIFLTLPTQSLCWRNREMVPLLPTWKLYFVF